MPATTLPDRALLRLSGEGVRDFLQGLVTSDVAGPLPVWAGLLTPQGKTLFDFFVWADSATTSCSMSKPKRPTISPNDWRFIACAGRS